MSLSILWTVYGVKPANSLLCLNISKIFFFDLVPDWTEIPGGLLITTKFSLFSINISDDKSRFIEVQWDVNNKNPFLVRLKIVFEDRKHLLKDLTESTSSLNINLKSVDISALDGVATCLMVLEISNIKELNRLKDQIIASISPIKIERV